MILAVLKGSSNYSCDEISPTILNQGVWTIRSRDHMTEWHFVARRERNGLSVRSCDEDQ